MRLAVFLTPEELIDIHHELISRFGGTHGILDRGLLESACYRPQSGYYESLFDQAAALLQSLAMNHIFVDGNKRIAWVAMKTFLAVNKVKIRVTADTAEEFLNKRMISGHADIAEIAKWLTQHALP